MKLSQRNLELKFLHCIVTYDDAIYLAGERMVEEYHFLTKEPGTNVSFTGRMYALCQEYASGSGGYKMTETVLESLMLKKGLKSNTQAKFLVLWDEVLEAEATMDDFPHLIQLMKDRYCTKLTGEMMDKITDQVSNDQIKESISTITEYVNIMTEEQDEFTKDKVEFDMSEASEYFFQEYDLRLENPTLFKGINCGLSKIDTQTFGWMPSQLIVLLAPTSGGKSVQMLNWADYAHRVCKKNVIYFSFEMSSWLCMLRHASLCADIPYHRLKSMSITAEEKEKLTQTFKRMENGPYFDYQVSIEDPTPEFVEQKIREITNAKGKPDLIVADYIGNMTTRTTSKNAKHWEKNGDAAEGLFKLAKRYNLPIITAQQINRDAVKENRKNKEAGKVAAYYQDAASGDQRLMHLAYYVIGLDPNKDDKICWYLPVKMRDAWFTPFATKWDPDYNKVIELTDAQQAVLTTVKTAELSTSANDFAPPKNAQVKQVEPVELDLSDWTTDFSGF